MSTSTASRVFSADDDDARSNSSGEMDGSLSDDEVTQQRLHSRPQLATTAEDLTANLPDDCLVHVFRKLGTSDLARCSLVCRRWFMLDAETRPSMSLRATLDAAPDLASLFRRFTGVQKLVLKCERNVLSIDDASLDTIARQCVYLRKLKLKNCRQITDDGMERFAQACPELRKFSCGSCGFGLRGLNALLNGCIHLEDLTVKRSLHPSLPKDRVTQIPHVSDSLSPPANLSLKRLCLKDQRQSHIWVPLLQATSRLETLILARNAGHWDQVLGSSLREKLTPELSQIYVERVQITDKGLQCIGKCPKLEALVVVRTPECTDAGMAAVAAGCSGLKRLHVEGWAPGHLGDPGLSAIARHCRQLQELLLVSHACTVSSLQLLASNCPSLERLTLCSGHNMGDPELATLAYSCSNLRRLCVKACNKVTDLGIYALANGCPSLQRLKVRRCPAVSAHSLSVLQEQRPTLRMPTVSVGRDRLFAALGKTYTEEEFDELCFEFGIELDDVTTEKAIIRKEKHLTDEVPAEDEEVIYKIEVPANRYDLLCLEGLARSLRIFLEMDPVPQFKLAAAASPIRMTVTPETALIRPFVVGAVLRNITFDQHRYNSFIDLQDRLHQNLCRRRTLVAIGTHDLDTLTPPFTYEALPPTEIKFVPLKQTKEFNAAELMEFYKSHNKLKKFLHIISESPVFPVIYDANRTVLSLPPVINGSHSAIKLTTRNVFIECTATDLTKAKIVLNTVVTMFSEFCDNKFEVEPVEVVSTEGQVAVYPQMEERDVETSVGYINKAIGVDLKAEEIARLLTRMQLPSKVVEGRRGEDGAEVVSVTVPPTRSDVLHPCDIMEDVAIAHGYNNIARTEPKTVCEGKQQPLNQLCDLLRGEVAQAGFTEVLTWALIARSENFEMVNLKDDGKTAVVIGNPRSADFEVVRSSLLPGMLKTLASNKDSPRPVKLFEVSDVCLLDESKDVGARNERRLIALYCNLHSGFEVIHGLVDRLMESLGVACGGQAGADGTKALADGPATQGDGGDAAKAAAALKYFIAPSQSPQFFGGRQADILCKGKSIGTFGVVHPEVLARFDIPDPCSAVEINLEPFLQL
ncbi:unnamed protein product [Closterium sp. NIES-65]|nr:unnamed protein product [Closterium sp. NIES-65]